MDRCPYCHSELVFYGDRVSCSECYESWPDGLLRCPECGHQGFRMVDGRPEFICAHCRTTLEVPYPEDIEKPLFGIYVFGCDPSEEGGRVWSEAEVIELIRSEMDEKPPGTLFFPSDFALRYDMDYQLVSRCMDAMVENGELKVKSKGGMVEQYRMMTCPLCRAEMWPGMMEDDLVHYDHPANGDCPIRTVTAHMKNMEIGGE